MPDVRFNGFDWRSSEWWML